MTGKLRLANGIFKVTWETFESDTVHTLYVADLLDNEIWDVAKMVEEFLDNCGVVTAIEYLACGHVITEQEND